MRLDPAYSENGEGNRPAPGGNENEELRLESTSPFQDAYSSHGEMFCIQYQRTTIVRKTQRVTSRRDLTHHSLPLRNFLDNSMTPSAKFMQGGNPLHRVHRAIAAFQTCQTGWFDRYSAALRVGASSRRVPAALKLSLGNCAERAKSAASAGSSAAKGQVAASAICVWFLGSAFFTTERPSFVIAEVANHAPAIRCLNPPASYRGPARAPSRAAPLSKCAWPLGQNGDKGPIDLPRGGAKLLVFAPQRPVSCPLAALRRVLEPIQQKCARS